MTNAILSYIFFTFKMILILIKRLFEKIRFNQMFRHSNSHYIQIPMGIDGKSKDKNKLISTRNCWFWWKNPKEWTQRKGIIKNCHKIDTKIWFLLVSVWVLQQRYQHSIFIFYFCLFVRLNLCLQMKKKTYSNRWKFHRVMWTYE